MSMHQREHQRRVEGSVRLLAVTARPPGTGPSTFSRTTISPGGADAASTSAGTVTETSSP